MPLLNITHVLFFRDSRSVVDGTGLLRGCEYYPAPTTTIPTCLMQEISFHSSYY
jgi:hypothetical protein